MRRLIICCLSLLLVSNSLLAEEIKAQGVAEVTSDPGQVYGRQLSVGH